MLNRKVLFVTMTDLGGAQAILPVLRQLKDSPDIECVVFTQRGSPAEDIFERNSIAVVRSIDYSYPTLDLQHMRVILSEVNPDAVLVGIAADNNSTDRLGLQAAQKEGIPCAALIETFPEIWLSRHEERDGSLYRGANLLLVPDSPSVGIAVKRGFDPRRVRAAGNPADDVLADEMPQLAWKRAHLRRDCDIPPLATVIAWFGTFDLDNPEHRGPAFEGRYDFGEAEAYREYLEAMRDAIPLAREQGRVLRGLFRQKPSYGRKGLREIEQRLEFGVSHDDHKDGPVAAIAASDLVCGIIGGTTLHQAAKLGVPGVFYQPGATAETDEQATNRLGITKPLYERGALRELILRIARDPTELGRLQRSLQPALIERGATKRVIHELRQLCL